MRKGTKYVNVNTAVTMMVEEENTNNNNDCWNKRKSFSKLKQKGELPQKQHQQQRHLKKSHESHSPHHHQQQQQPQRDSQLSHSGNRKVRHNNHQNHSKCTNARNQHNNNNDKKRSYYHRRKVQHQQNKMEEEKDDDDDLFHDCLTWKEKSRYVALDCEMVGVGDDGIRSALARVSIVDWNGTCLLDTIVKVKEPVTDYRTFVSGITQDDLESEKAMDYHQVRSIVKSLLHGKILIGHALKNDLAVLQLQHPWYDTRDTAKYKPFMKQIKKEVMGPRKLKEIVYENLGMTIQHSSHSSMEDSISALLLYKKVRIDWEKVMEYKIYKTKCIQHEEEEKIDPPTTTTTATTNNMNDATNHARTIPTYKSILGQ